MSLSKKKNPNIELYDPYQFEYRMSLDRNHFGKGKDIKPKVKKINYGSKFVCYYKDKINKSYVNDLFEKIR